MDDDEQMSDMLTVREVARLLHVHPNTLRRWSNNGRINACRITPRGDRRFRRAEIARFLREYKQERKALYHELGRELTLDDLVFAGVEGKSLNLPSVSRDFSRISKRAGLENARFHDLRHTFASLALKQGIHPKVISEALGHSSVAFTMNVYSHIIEGMQAEAMARLGEVLPPGRLSNNSVANSSLLVNIKLAQN